MVYLKLVFIFKNLKIKYLYNFTGRNSVAMMTTELLLCLRLPLQFLCFIVI